MDFVTNFLIRDETMWQIQATRWWFMPVANRPCETWLHYLQRSWATKRPRQTLPLTFSSSSPYNNMKSIESQILGQFKCKTITSRRCGMEDKIWAERLTVQCFLNISPKFSSTYYLYLPQFQKYVMEPSYMLIFPTFRKKSKILRFLHLDSIVSHLRIKRSLHNGNSQGLRIAFH